MKEQFRGYYTPDETELNRLWNDGLIILDTNALLNLFRYTPSTRNDFVGVLKLVRDRLWIPHQVGSEFQRNRLDVIEQQVRAFDEIESALTNAKSSVLSSLDKFRRHPSLNAVLIAEKLELHLSEISETVAKSKTEHTNTAIDDRGNEQTFAEITALYAGKVGDRYPEKHLADLFADGVSRYAAKIPPGYKDQSKGEPEKYGDLVLWKQILDKGIETSRPAIFVTDDAKEDWWYEVKGKTQGPRPELVEEYFSATGERIHFYSPERFLTFALERSNTKAKAGFLTEVEEVSNQRTSVRAEQQLLLRRDQLENDRARLLRQLPNTQDGALRVPNSLLRQISQSNDRLDRLHREHAVTSAELENLSAAIESDQFDGIERDNLILSLGRLQHEQRAKQDRISEAADQRDRYMRVSSRQMDPERIDQVREQIERIESQLEAVDLALDELSD